MRRYIFADEAGDFNFSRGQNISKYYIICTISLLDDEIGHELLRLRRNLIWQGLPVRQYFHASEDKQAVRDAVFTLIANFPIVVQATILEKSKAQPQTRTTNARFYQYGWYYHFFGIRATLANANDELLITAASVGTKKGQAVFTSAVNDVVQQHVRHVPWKTHFCPAMADPCLQIADYCTWAIQRKWEQGDARSYNTIAPLVRHEYDSWKNGARHYY